MISFFRYGCGFSILFLILLVVENASSSTSRSPRNSDISNMADALKYLQDLDTYYGDRARVRFGKRTSPMTRDRIVENPETGPTFDLTPPEEPF